MRVIIIITFSAIALYIVASIESVIALEAFKFVQLCYNNIIVLHFACIHTFSFRYSGRVPLTLSCHMYVYGPHRRRGPHTSVHSSLHKVGFYPLLAARREDARCFRARSAGGETAAQDLCNCDMG